jgi:hypothetical protein
MLSYATSHWHSLYGTCKQSAHERGTVTTILPYLYLSDYKAALSTETFNRLKITHVISVIEHRPSYPVDPKQSLHVPIADKVDVDVLAWLDTTTEFIRHALEDRGQTAENGNRVLVWLVSRAKRKSNSLPEGPLFRWHLTFPHDNLRLPPCYSTHWLSDSVRCN